MPEEIGQSGITTYLKYDGNGQRAKKSVNGEDTLYINQYFEVKNGLPIKYIFAGNLRVAQIKGSEVSYFHKDHLGSSSIITDVNGNTTETNKYMPFGVERGTHRVDRTKPFASKLLDELPVDQPYPFPKRAVILAVRLARQGALEVVHDR